MFGHLRPQMIAAQDAKSDASLKEMYTRLDAKYHDCREV